MLFQLQSSAHSCVRTPAQPLLRAGCVALTILEVSLKKQTMCFKIQGTNEESSQIIDFKPLMPLLNQPDIARKET